MMRLQKKGAHSSFPLNKIRLCSQSVNLSVSLSISQSVQFGRCYVIGKSYSKRDWHNMSAQHLILRDSAVSLHWNSANAHSHTFAPLHLIYPLLFPSPLLLSALLISSHRLPDCLSVFPCCYFRIHHQVFRSHAVSSPGKEWIMQTSLITPCANPPDWKSMCTQVAGKWMELTHQPVRQDGRGRARATPHSVTQRFLLQHVCFSRVFSKYNIGCLEGAACLHSLRAECDENKARGTKGKLQVDNA